jgi:dTDP-4-dehydrorhamnose reductase
MTEKPFLHKKAFANSKSNFLFQEDVAKILFKLINKKGIVNVGGKIDTIYNFAKKSNPKVRKIYLKNNSKIKFPKNSSMNINKLKNYKININ